MYLKLYYLKINRIEKLLLRELEVLIYNIFMVFIKILIFRFVLKFNVFINILLFLLIKKSYNILMYLIMCYILIEYNIEVYRFDVLIFFWVFVFFFSFSWAGVIGL